MKRVVLVGINARYTHTNLALRYLRETCKDLDLDLRLHEYTINQKKYEILQSLYKTQPEIIAFSVYIWNSLLIRALLPDLKKLLPKSTIILGGPEVSYNAEKWIKDLPEIDFIIKGYGEAAFRDLLKSNLKIPQKILYEDNIPFNNIPFPYTSDELKSHNKKYIYYEASRGCIFKCDYCISSRNDQRPEYKDIALVKRELDHILKCNPRIVKFIDRSFNANKPFAYAIWEYLIGKKTNTKFHFELYPSLIEDKDLEILKLCPPDRFQFEIGVQSTNKATLKAIHRFYEWEKIKPILSKLVKLKNIHIHLDFIAGLPLENFLSAKKSISDIYSLHADHFQLGFLKVLPGTAIHEESKTYEMNFSNSPPYEVFKNKWLTYDDMIELKKVENSLNIFYNSGKYKTFILNFEKDFANPYEMLNILSNFREKHDINNQTRDWQQNAKMLVDLLDHNFAEQKDFYMDCLRWDWCKIANAHYYPAAIFHKAVFNSKDDGSTKLKELKLHKELTSRQIRSAIFFKAVTNRFKKQYMQDSDIVAFIRKDKQRKPIYL